jgi:hypothetical protein
MVEVLQMGLAVVVLVAGSGLLAAARSHRLPGVNRNQNERSS